MHEAVLRSVHVPTGAQAGAVDFLQNQVELKYRIFDLVLSLVPPFGIQFWISEIDVRVGISPAH